MIWGRVLQIVGLIGGAFQRLGSSTRAFLSPTVAFLTNWKDAIASIGVIFGMVTAVFGCVAVTPKKDEAPKPEMAVAEGAPASPVKTPASIAQSTEGDPHTAPQTETKAASAKTLAAKPSLQPEPEPPMSSEMAALMDNSAKQSELINLEYDIKIAQAGRKAQAEAAEKIRLQKAQFNTMRDVFNTYMRKNELEKGVKTMEKLVRHLKESGISTDYLAVNFDDEQRSSAVIAGFFSDHRSPYERIKIRLQRQLSREVNRALQSPPEARTQSSEGATPE